MKTGDGPAKRNNPVKKTMRKIVRSTVLLSVFFLFFSACAKRVQYEQFTLNGRTMGTTFSIKIVTPKNAGAVQEQIDEQIYALLDTVNSIMSTYIETSDISMFNAYAGTDTFKVSPELVYVVKMANHISDLSGGAFDITIGPMVNLWGFGAESRNITIPPEIEIQEKLALVGYKKLSCSQTPPALSKQVPQLYCDLAGIAKGYGVDEVADFIESKGYQNYLVEIGGEIRTRGINQSGRKWRVGISSPVNNAGIQKVVEVNDSGMATSGDYRNYFEKDGVRYSHTIDPRNGRPITHKLASVTVLHDTCMVADAMATAISVLGPEIGYEFALKQNLLAFMIVKDENGFVEKMTPGFEKLISVPR